MEPVNSTANKRVVGASRLHRARSRREAGMALIEGPNVLADAISAGAGVLEVFGAVDDSGAEHLARSAGALWIPVTVAVLRKLAGTDSPRGPVAVIEIPTNPSPGGRSIWLDVTDPGNAGTLIRTAGAFGFAAVVAPSAVDPWSPKTLRSGAGGHFRTPVSSGPPPDTFTIATVAEVGIAIAEAASHLPEDGSYCLLLGNEAHGLDPATVESADLVVSVPMTGDVDSLNVAIAGAICMYELTRRP